MVLNKKTHGIPEGAVYIGRPSKWGNPFAMKSEADRTTVVGKFIIYILDSNSKALRDEARSELRGKNLVCFCAPAACHGDVLEVVANSNTDDELFEHYKETWNNKELWAVKG